MAEGSKVRIETYDAEEWERQNNSKKVPPYINEFGIEQNRYNKIVVNRLRKAESECRELAAQMQEMNDYYQQQFASFDEIVETLHSEIEELKSKLEEQKKETDRLRLTAKLNSNSIERIMKMLPGSIDIDID